MANSRAEKSNGGINPPLQEERTGVEDPAGGRQAAAITTTVVFMAGSK